MSLARIAALCTALVLSIANAAAEVRVRDDSGKEVVLAAPARRIVSLAPHITETLFAAGAGHLVVGTVSHSDYPEAARSVPLVGDYTLLDLERIVSLRPDLIVVWLDGNSERHVEKVKKLGVPVYYDRPGRLGEIPSSLVRLGRLAGTAARAQAAAREFTARQRRIEARNAGKPEVRVFFQVWPRPLLTVNGTHIISDVIRLCGGRNVFAEAKALVPTLDVEAVLAAEPEIALRTGAEGDADAFELWRRLPHFRPTAAGNLVMLPTDALSRHSPRILDGADMLCTALDAVRARRRT
ncbi:MAG TPA: cobalamin-binding protein [Usitatibacter sp.]|nr:cobalamin-binding protein [Usitatibacter sp.]